VFLSLHLVHRFKFSIEIWLVKIHELIALGCFYPDLVSLGLRLLESLQLSREDCGNLVAFVVITWKPPIELWILLRACASSLTSHSMNGRGRLGGPLTGGLLLLPTGNAYSSSTIEDGSSTQR
jgi:hypothetical protein